MTATTASLARMYTVALGRASSQRVIITANSMPKRRTLTFLLRQLVQDKSCRFVLDASPSAASASVMSVDETSAIAASSIVEGSSSTAVTGAGDGAVPKSMPIEGIVSGVAEDEF